MDRQFTAEEFIRGKILCRNDCRENSAINVGYVLSVESDSENDTCESHCKRD